ncbi:MAG: DUF58 domain-containing protein [Polyangiaceae bacterium]
MRAERRSKKKGSGVEFADHRDYVPGDDFRYVDWNAFSASTACWCACTKRKRTSASTSWSTPRAR